MKKPGYDIINFKAHIEKEAVSSGKLGGQTTLPNSASNSAATAWHQSNAETLKLLF